MSSVLARGIDLGNMLDSRSRGSPELRPGAAALADAGFKTVRVPACRTGHLDADGTVEEDFASRVDSVVDGPWRVLTALDETEYR